LFILITLDPPITSHCFDLNILNTLFYIGDQISHPYYLAIYTFFFHLAIAIYYYSEMCLHTCSLMLLVMYHLHFLLSN
jgi:hypothetical protein